MQVHFTKKNSESRLGRFEVSPRSAGGFKKEVKSTNETLFWK